MKLKTLYALVAAGGLGLAAASAQAAIVVDGWQFNTNPAIASNTTNIGHLVVQGGSATVNQEVNGAGNPFAGANFNEFGLTFSVTYIPESAPGANDSGGPAFFNGALDSLRITFSDLAGTVQSIGAGGLVNYLFTPGAGSVTVEGSTDGGATFPTLLATLGVISPSGGDLNNFAGSTGTLGSSTLDLNIVSAITGLFADSTGTAFNPDDIFLEVTTTNKISSPASAVAPCGDGLTGNCRTLNITSEGAVNLLRVPEPATLGLLGISLIGLAAARRRKATQA